MDYKMTIAGLERHLPLCKVTDDLYIAGFIMFNDVEGAKLYMQDVVKVQVNSITTDHIQTLCLGRDEREQIQGKRTLIVDDVISTGESLAALETLVETVGGEIVGKFTVLAEGEAADRTDITYLEYLPLFNSDGTPQ